MAQVALDPAHRRISVEEFLAMDLRGAKAELEDGVIYMMAGGTEQHARVGGNILAFLRAALRGSGCRPYGSDFAARTGPQSIRFPDVSVYCTPRPTDPTTQLLGDPRVVVEVLSPSTASYDQKVKLEEYRSLAGAQDIVLVDIERERVRIVSRTAPEEWTDRWLEAGSDVPLRSLQMTIPHAEIFAED